MHSEQDKMCVSLLENKEDVQKSDLILPSSVQRLTLLSVGRLSQNSESCILNGNITACKQKVISFLIDIA